MNKEINMQNRFVYTLPFYLAAILLIFFVRDCSFFWDNILVGSIYANWYYKLNFTEIFVPESIAGYPPLFGMYLAGVWKIFGRSLNSSHWAMLPFLFGIIYQSYLLASSYLKEKWIYIGMSLMLLDTTVLAQLTQIGPDVPMVFFYLWCVNGIIYSQKKYLIFGLLAMSLLSPRAEIAIFAIGFSDLLFNHRFIFNKYSNLLVLILPYLPSLIVLFIWHYFHFQHYGWVFFNVNTNDYAEYVGWKDVLRNAAVISWRVLDFGRIVPILITSFVLWKAYKMNKIQTDINQILYFLCAPLLIYSVIFIFFKNPIAHRYFLVVFIFAGLLFTKCIMEYATVRFKKIMVLCVLAIFIAAHFIVYPNGIAKGWDASLAYLPYDKSRKEMIGYLRNHNILPCTVRADFPAYASFDDTDLNGDTSQFRAIESAKTNYIMYSNVMNGDEIATETQGMYLLHEIKHGQVFCRLYSIVPPIQAIQSDSKL